MSQTSMRVAVTGASGKMGQLLIQETLRSSHHTLALALDRDESPMLGRDAGSLLGEASGVVITQDLAGLAGVDVLIDFTRPEASLLYMDACERHGVRLVLGTTGFDAQGLSRVHDFAKRQPLVFAPNMSVGVNLLLRLVETAAHALKTGYDIEIIEAHHRQKVDAPSGTALEMGRVAARASGRRLEHDAVYSRQGHTGARTDSEIGFSVIRGGDIVGDHTVLFAGMGERIELTHRSSSRATYAQGALRAASFLREAAPGLYDMQDVLGLKAQ